MVVEQDVADALAAAGRDGCRLFAASCAERMAPLFGAVRGAEGGRDDDIATVVDALDAVWENGAAPPVGLLDRVRRFPELEDDDELVEVGDTYAFYAVLTLMYALSTAVSGDHRDAVKCAHAALTAMDLLDRNVPSARLSDQERRRQRETSAAAPVPATREADAAVGRERSAVVLARMRA